MSTQKSSLSTARIFGIKGLTAETPEAEILQAIQAKARELETAGTNSPSDSSIDVQEIERTVTTPEGEVFTTREGRAPRSHEDRTVSTRSSDAWIPASIIPSPIAQDGWVFRYVRTAMLGQADNTNVSKKFREGWVPARLEDHPELKVEADFGSRWGKQGNIEIGGLLLCKIPIEEIVKRRKFIAELGRRQMETVDQNYMQQNDPRMPLLMPSHGKSRTQFRGG